MSNLYIILNHVVITQIYTVNIDVINVTLSFSNHQRQSTSTYTRYGHSEIGAHVKGAISVIGSV